MLHHTSSTSSTPSASGSVRAEAVPPPAEVVQEPHVQHAVAAERPRELRRQVHAATFSWGSFLFTHRGQGASTAWQCTCRYHSGEGSSLRCTKTQGFKSDAESQAVIRMLKSWALTATHFTTKQEHQGSRKLMPLAAEHQNLDDDGLDQLLAQMPPPP